MNHRVHFLFFSLIIIACSSPSDTKQLLEEKIFAVENNLQVDFRIKGDSIPTYNIEDRMRELGINGVSIAVLHDGEIEWAKGYGIADTATSRKVNAETMFLAGSISKPVAATRAHQLADEGIIDLDSNVNHYLTSWHLPDNEFTENEKVTTRRILNHTAGLTVWGFPGYDKGDTIPSVADVLDGKGNTDSVRVYKIPGESWQYSGGGYTIMQLMITDQDRKPFSDIMQETVLNPLGMTKSTFKNPLPDRFHDIAATGYRGDGSEVEGLWPIYPEMAAAGLWTTPSQLILWAKEIQQIYQSGEDGLLKYETVQEMLTPGEGGHGLGPGVSDHSFGHGGADEGFRAIMTAWKDTTIAIVIMVNSDNGSIIQEILLSFAQTYNLPGIDPLTRSVKKLSEENKSQYVGKYSFPKLGKATISLKEEGWEFFGDFMDKPVYLLAESDSLLFDTKDGTALRFIYDDNAIVGLKVQGFEAEKIE